MRLASCSRCSALALAAALAQATAADAQRSFQAEGRVVFGSATINQANGTVVQVASPQTVINWTPDATAPLGAGNPTDFQPAGTTATFTTQAGSGLDDFAVLNRILSLDNSRPIQLNGTILARLQGDAAQAAGTVYFYSPGGIVVGSNAVMDVGSLGLTTADPWGGSGSWLSPDRSVQFAASLPGRAITVAPGASLVSSGSPSSYTAIVAPQILHRGSIRTSGGAALVAADAATITFSPDNLYTIQVSAAAAGSSGGLTVDGGSIGSTAGGAAAAQRLYLVSIPKNAAVTMLIQGGADLGFTPADQARVDGNAIVLSAGSDIARGALGAPSNGLVGNAIIQDANFRDRTIAGVTGSANLLALSGDLRFASDLTIRAGTVTMRAENKRSLAVAGNLLADARQVGTASNATGFGGSIEIVAGKANALASGGTIGIAGSATLLADGNGFVSGIGVGGVIELAAYGGGRVQLGGDLLASANGIGGAGTSGGEGIGGSVRIGAQGGSLALNNVRLSSSGHGGNGLAGAGGSGRGGAITLQAAGGQLTLNGSADIDVGGAGGSGAGGARGGDAQNGRATLSAQGAPLLIAGAATVRANATGGASSGTGRGGEATVGGAGGLVVTAAQGGSIAADVLDAAATATGGTSAGGNGGSFNAGGTLFQLSDAEARFGRVAVAISAAVPAASAVRDHIGLDRSSALVSGDFSFATSGSLGLSSNAGNFAAGGLALKAGASISIDGAWTAPTIDITAGDIALGQGGSLTATGDLRLASANPGAMLIGDGLAGQGFALSDAEFGRLKGGSITLTGHSGGSVAPTILLGKLTLTGAQLGAGGTLRITSAATGERTGVIGLAGQLNGTGLSDAQTVELEASRIEIDATSGGIDLGGSGVVPAGRLNLRTDRLWAADPAVLGKLGGNAAYLGREADLATPLMPARPNGIVRAGVVQFVDTGQILIQNSGTRTAPAGITTADGAFLTFASSRQSRGQVELIVHGQIVGASGTPTAGFAVQNALTRAKDFSGLQFTPNSTVNGCLVSAATCGPVLVTYLSVLPALPDKLFGDGDQGDVEGESGVITPAEKLVDRKPMERAQPIDEPVSGGGNPSLMSGGSPSGGVR